jgi:hypothetical protein
LIFSLSIQTIAVLHCATLLLCTTHSIIVTHIGGIQRPTGDNKMIHTYKAVTFNANIVIGKGATSAEAKADAAKKAAELGSCIRKRI